LSVTVKEKENMKGTTRFIFDRMFFAIGAVLACWCLVVPTLANAQGGQGQNAVYSAAGSCCMGSPGFIDASMFKTSATNICGILHNILNGASYLSMGAVIDARGLNSGNTSMICTSTNPSPWAGITSPPPSTILLPAGTIVIPSTWVLPSYTHLIGEGSGITSSGFTPGTTLQVASTFTAPGPMIQFGSSSGCCSAISVENLTLDGTGGSVNGIVNQNAGDHSYVNNVGLYRILGTGLSVSGTANNSGPYSNITYDLGGISGNSATVCASINGVSGTRGIHGLTCISENNDPPAAVLLDSSNNSIEDVRIVGFYDGVLVGANASAQSNVLINIIGDTAAVSGLTPVNAVHISSNNTVTDLSIMGLSNSGLTGTYTLQDDVTGPHLSDPTVGIYALGRAASGGHSRFTTSPNAATWAVGTSSPSISSTCARGSLYSCIGGSTCVSGSTAYALWACVLNGSTIQWLPVK
jgi:hypothetical protein